MTITPLRSVDQQTEEYEQQLAFVRQQQHLLSLAEIELQRRAQQGHAGAAGETAVTAAVQRVIVDLGQAEWRLLVDRKWPASKGNIDTLLVGPPGVVVLDAKNWREPRIEGGRLWRGDEPMDDEVEKVRHQAEAVVDALAGNPLTPQQSLAPTSATPFLVFARKRFTTVVLDGVTVLGERNLHTELLRLPRRLDNAAVIRVAEALDAVCPPMIQPDAPPSRSEPKHAGPPVPEQPASEDALFDAEDVWRALTAAACAEPVETWMTWLHPVQTALATRSYSGPARIRGVAGSGKTVVALHRARHLSRSRDSRVLVTTFVRNLPEVQRTLFARLSPSTAKRVEFSHLHRWARRHLTERGHRFDLGEPGRNADSAFTRAWASSGVGAALSNVNRNPTYWKDEITHVIKGRGLTTLGQYAELDRVGRRTPLRAEQRELVWRLYERYQELLQEQGLVDYDDLISMALDSVRAEPIEHPYTAVIVDEAQDLSCQGMRLLHALAGDGPDGLLVVGDGQQAVYPGGYTLKEAGVSVTGRSTVLTRNYRNGSAILEAALEVVSQDDFTDLDVEIAPGARGCETDRPGGVVRRFPSVDRRSQREELIADLQIQLDGGTRPGDIGVLTRTTKQADEWAASLKQAGIAVQDLATYDGSLSTGVKVGTYRRAKGLEFAQVYVPDLDSAVSVPSDPAKADAWRERNELERRCLFVAMTRARDRLWLGTVARV
ncbi:MAG: UvrD-helicase domain-containing protein [Microbacteriaceae bacterium]